ncbi:hypothetical protein ACFFG3_10240, partial [Ralstonia solanacearum]
VRHVARVTLALASQLCLAFSMVFFPHPPFTSQSRGIFKRALSEFGPEQLGVVDDFESGRADVRPHMGETIRAVCDKWRAHGDRGQHGLLLVIGSTDRVRLSPTSATQYESNVGLARARAEQVKARLLDCSIPTGQMVTMVSGPRYTPASGVVVPSDAARDRSVVVWALWSVPSQ